MASKVLGDAGLIEKKSCSARNFLTVLLCLLSLIGAAADSVADSGEGDLVGRRLASVVVNFDNLQQKIPHIKMLF